jgi:hypothetical protein
VGKPLLTFLAVAVLRSKRHDLLRIMDPDEDFTTTGRAFSANMQLFSRLNAGDREEMPNVRWCVLKALSMYSQMPKSVINSMEHDQQKEAERHRKYRQTKSTNNATSDDIVVDIERERRFGSFVSHETNDFEMKVEKDPGFLDNKEDNKSYNNKDEEEDCLAVCHPPAVGWDDVGMWLNENSCVIVDLRDCDKKQHQWLLQHFTTDRASRASRASRVRSASSGGKRSSSGATVARRRRRQPSRLLTSELGNKNKNMKEARFASKRISFLHVPFVPKSVQEATLLVQHLITLLRNWGVGNGYIVLVTAEGEQDESILCVSSALMRAAIPRVCSLKLDPRFAVQPTSLLSGATSNTEGTYLRTQQKSFNIW